ncbi:hypothetical protein FKM82_028308 [Ascaphus truei]
MAQRLDWGRGKGCDFVMKSCKLWLDQQRRKMQSGSPFCDTLRSNPLKLTCRQDQKAVAICNLQRFPQHLPREYQVQRIIHATCRFPSTYPGNIRYSALFMQPAGSPALTPGISGTAHYSSNLQRFPQHLPREYQVPRIIHATCRFPQHLPREYQVQRIIHATCSHSPSTYTGNIRYSALYMQPAVRVIPVR